MKNSKATSINDLGLDVTFSDFDKIIPCGLENSKATSIKDLGLDVTFYDFDKALKYNFEKLLKII